MSRTSYLEDTQTVLNLWDKPVQLAGDKVAVTARITDRLSVIALVDPKAPKGLGVFLRWRI